MQEIDSYLQKIRGPRLSLDESPDQDLAMVVIIPVYKEYFELLKETLDSLISAQSNEIKYECYILINNAAEDEEGRQVNQHCYDQCNKYLAEHNSFYCFWHQFESRKESGVGHARKMAMDLAVGRFADFGKDGLIINLDADTRVEPNYFNCIQQAFAEYPGVEAMGQNLAQFDKGRAKFCDCLAGPRLAR